MLDDAANWAYGEPATAIAGVSSHYRVGAAPGVGAPEAAPPRLKAALATARAALEERGYRIGPAPTAWVVLSLGTKGERVVRLGLHVGGALEGVFRPHAISIVLAEGAGEDPCPLETEARIRDLIGALPPATP